MVIVVNVATDKLQRPSRVSQDMSGRQMIQILRER